MRTEAEFLTQMVAGAIHCPCDHKCMAKPPKLPPAFAQMPIHWEHKSYQEYMTCLSRYVQTEVFDALRGLQSRGGKNAGYPQGGYILLYEKAEPKVFEKPLKDLKIHFADTNAELHKILTHHLFTLCEKAVEEFRR